MVVGERCLDSLCIVPLHMVEMKVKPLDLTWLDKTMQISTQYSAALFNNAKQFALLNSAAHCLIAS